MMFWIWFIIITVLWWIGGGRPAWVRDWLLPFFVGAIAWFHHYPWWISLMVAGTCNIIRVGYGAYDPEHDDKPSLLGSITKDRSGIGERALWGLLCGLIAPLPAVIWQTFTGHPVFLLKMLGYAFSFSAICAVAIVIDKVIAWKRLPCDLIISSGFSIIFWLL